MYLVTSTVCATTTDREGKREREGGTGGPECDERKRVHTSDSSGLHNKCDNCNREKKETGFSIYIYIYIKEILIKNLSL